jgi:hypothetical protein
MILEALKSGALIGFTISGAAMVVVGCGWLLLMLLAFIGNALGGKNKRSKGE